ncbi:MAG: lipoprotein [Arcobacteraceae bacterium]|jgi:hypothetical protein|nr:lipoprotein [Arcobacteraceae bacterium]
MKNIIFILTITFILSGCYSIVPTYSSFEYKRNHYLLIHNSHIIPKYFKERREDYDENRYIYKFNGDDPRCVYAYLTHKDDNPEMVREWFIISGKEYCKEAPGIGEWI